MTQLRDNEERPVYVVAYFYLLKKLHIIEDIQTY